MLTGTRPFGSGTKHLSPSFSAEKRVRFVYCAVLGGGWLLFFPFLRMISIMSPFAIPFPPAAIIKRRFIFLFKTTFYFFFPPYSPFTHSSRLPHAKCLSFAEKQNNPLRHIFLLTAAVLFSGVEMMPFFFSFGVDDLEREEKKGSSEGFSDARQQTHTHARRHSASYEKRSRHLSYSTK